MTHTDDQQWSNNERMLMIVLGSACVRWTQSTAILPNERQQWRVVS